MSRRTSCFLLSIGLALLIAGEGRALTLADLTGGGSFSTANGLLFDSFQATLTGNQASLSQSSLDILVLDDGFRIAGPISAADGEIGDILIAYRVTAVSPENLIVRASLLSNVSANGVGAQAAVDELLSEIGALGPALSLHSFDTGALEGDGVFFDQVEFEPASGFQVFKDILVDSTLLEGGFGGSARISIIEQHFDVVPEPATLGMLIVGLMGLSAAGRRRIS